jgi:hypothetical protein
MRYANFVPNDILKEDDLTDTADNGIIQINTIAELDLLNSNVNMAFCLEDFECYKRIKLGKGADCWEVF